MIILKAILNAYGYRSSEQQKDLIKIGAYCGFYGEDFLNKWIADEVADKFLIASFDTPEEGMAWWGELADKHWLRASFKKEGIGIGKDLTINVLRWAKDQTVGKKDEERQLLESLKRLGLVDEGAWPNQPVSQVVIHGAMGDCLEGEIYFIPEDYSGLVVLVSSARGAFNDDPRLANILASWFDRPDAQTVAIIQQVLDKHKDVRTSNKNWLKDLEGLQAEILIALGEKAWPYGKGWYYENPEPFETTTKADGRQSLAGWPTAMDIVEYLIEERRQANPEKFKGIKLAAIYSVRTGRLPTTEHNIEDWYEQNRDSFPPKTPVVFISNNDRHYITFQDKVAKETLKRVAKLPDPGVLDACVVTAGPGAKTFNLSAATDALAKIFFMGRKEALARLKAWLEHKEGKKRESMFNQLESGSSLAASSAAAFSLQPKNSSPLGVEQPASVPVIPSAPLDDGMHNRMFSEAAWNSRVMKKELAAIFSGYLWKGNANKQSAWVYFSDIETCEKARKTVHDYISSRKPICHIEVERAVAPREKNVGGRFAIILQGVTHEELQKLKVGHEAGIEFGQ